MLAFLNLSDQHINKT